MNSPDRMLVAWAARSPEVRAVALIGSRSRESPAAPDRADGESDWDFHVITSHPARFANTEWMQAAGFPTPIAYVDRLGVLGSSKKVTVLLPGTELDLVILPAGRLRLARMAMALGLHRRSAGLRRALGDLAIVIRPGYRFLHGAGGWGGFYQKVVAEVPDPRLDDAAVRRLAEGFVCDYVWLQRKLARGEFIAARRMLHRGLAEVNLQLAHELRLRRGELSFPDARRLEQVLAPAAAAELAAPADGTPEELSRAVAHCAGTFRTLMTALRGETWRWPLA